MEIIFIKQTTLIKRKKPLTETEAVKVMAVQNAREKKCKDQCSFILKQIVCYTFFINN